jgi:hypothetical protein
MEIGLFIPSGSQFDNDIAEPSRRGGNPFWTFLTPLLGLQPEHLPWDNEGVSPNVARIREYEARRAEANNSVPLKVTLADLAQEAVTHDQLSELPAGVPVAIVVQSVYERFLYRLRKAGFNVIDRKSPFPSHQKEPINKFCDELKTIAAEYNI